MVAVARLSFPRYFPCFWSSQRQKICRGLRLAWRSTECGRINLVYFNWPWPPHHDERRIVVNRTAVTGVWRLISLADPALQFKTPPCDHVYSASCFQICLLISIAKCGSVISYALREGSRSDSKHFLPLTARDTKRRCYLFERRESHSQARNYS